MVAGQRPGAACRTEFNEFAPRLSPNGQSVAYVSNRGDEDRVYLQSFPEGGSVIPVSSGPGTEPVWSRDGRELFYRDGSRMLVVEVEHGTELKFGIPRVLFDRPYALDPRSAGYQNYDVSRDGRFVMIANPGFAADAERPKLVLVENWFEELKRLVPTGRPGS